MSKITLELKGGWYYPLRSKSLNDLLLCQSSVKRFFGASGQRITVKVQTKPFDGSTPIEIRWHPRYALLEWRIIGGAKYWKQMNGNAMAWMRKRYTITGLDMRLIFHIEMKDKP